MTHESTASITRERKRRNKKKKKVGEKERWRICFGLAHYYYYYYFDETIFISFRCNFCTWVHLACRLLLSCLLIFFFFFLKKVLVVCFNKDGDFVLVQLIHFISFFFIYQMKLYLFHLDVPSPEGFILHVDYYFLFCFFFPEKVLLICFNLLYVVM